MSWRRRRPAGLPTGWEQVAERILPAWARFSDEERDRLGELTDVVLRHKRWEAAAGFALDDGMRLVIAAQAALLVLGLDIDYYRDVQSIIVHPTTVTLTGPRPGPVQGVVTDSPQPIIGQANGHRGPVIIAWDAARADVRHPERGRNVVFHEFAHKLDLLDDVINGTPPLPDAAARERWQQVCTAEYGLLRSGAGDGLLSDYGAVDPGEFFAVATETFFDLPGEMAARKPALYAVLRDFYRQDPAARLRG
ncbi:MAG: zinc-dependent peptidase [Acidimicrobiia bacterium]